MITTTTMFSLGTCGSECGYAAAFAACLAFGSFGVPLKAAKSVDVDPLVFQSYKTAMCLITSLIALVVIPGVKLSFTPWGIVSGLFWVPSGTAHICGIRAAGLAIAQGTCSSAAVMVSFAWGMIVFHEGVYSLPVASFAVSLMIFGICGMSYFSADGSKSALQRRHSEIKKLSLDWDIDDTAEKLTSGDIVKSATSGVEMIVPKKHSIKKKIVNGLQPSPASVGSPFMTGMEEDGLSKLIEEDTMDDAEGGIIGESAASFGGTQLMMVSLSKHLKRTYDISLTPAQLGLTMSALSGVWGGSVMVPLHFAGPQAKGLNFTFSFAVGASLVNILLWLMRYCYHLCRAKSLTSAAGALPSFHFRPLLLCGALSGTIWSIGNIASILSVTFLGEGVGYSLTQSSMLVGGLWGVFYFGEIRGRCAISGWFFSALISLAGIVLLSSQHMPTPRPLLHKG